MVAWVNEILAIYVVTAPDHVVPLLILDSYRCRMMGSVVQKIQELGVEVQAAVPPSASPMMSALTIISNIS